MGSAAPLAGAASRPLLSSRDGKSLRGATSLPREETGEGDREEGGREPLRSPRCCCGARTAAAATAHSAMLPPPACGSCQGACAAEPAEEWPGSFSSPFYPSFFRRVPHIRRERKSGKGVLRSRRLNCRLPFPFRSGGGGGGFPRRRLSQVAIAASG